jgi:hypothetical protein
MHLWGALQVLARQPLTNPCCRYACSHNDGYALAYTGSGQLCDLGGGARHTSFGWHVGHHLKKIGKRYAFEPHARQATPVTEQWLENAIEAGTTRNQFAIVDQNVSNLVLNHKTSNTERHAYSLNIAFDTGSNISVTFSRELLDPSTIVKYSKPSGTEVHGGGVAYATHWGYASMRLGITTKRLRMDLMPSCRTTIIAGGEFDDGHLAFSCVKRILSIYLVSDMQQPLAQFPRTMDKPQWKGANPDFLSSLTLEGGVAMCSLFPVPDNTFEL